MFKKFTKIVIILFALITLLSSSIITGPNVANAASRNKKPYKHGNNYNQKQQTVFNIFYEVAKILGVNEQTIIDKVKNGMTLEEIAKSYNMSESKLLDHLEDRAEENIDEALKDRTMTQTQANNMKNYLRVILKVLIENKYTSTSNLLAAPDNITARSKNKNSIILNWNSVTKSKYYYIYRATSYSGYYKLIGKVKSTGYTDKKLKNRATYYYKVKAFNSFGFSPYSSVVNATVGEKYKSLGSPSCFTAKTVSETQISLQWNSVSKATNYYIYRATSFAGTYTKIGSSNKTNYTDKSLNQNTTYFYKVQAVNSSSKSELSSVVSATTFDESDGYIDVPKNLIITAVSEDEISLKWDKVYDAQSYFIYRSNSNSGTYSKIATITDTEYKDEKLSNNITYYYKVRAYDHDDTSDYSSVVYATTDEEYDIDAPDDLEITYVSEDEISLEWDKVYDAKCYYIYRSKSVSGSYSKVATVADTDYTDYDLNDDTTYYYKVKAFDGKDSSDYSSIVHATTNED